jgi:hypothetical protein
LPLEFHYHWYHSDDSVSMMESRELVIEHRFC